MQQNLVSSYMGTWPRARPRLFYDTVMNNFMCQPCWTVVSNFLVKFQPTCCWEGILDTINIWSVDFKESRSPSIMGVGLIQSDGGLKSNDWGLPKKEEFCFQTVTYSASISSLWPQDCNVDVTWICRPLACRMDFGLASPMTTWASCLLLIHRGEQQLWQPFPYHGKDSGAGPVVMAWCFQDWRAQPWTLTLPANRSPCAQVGFTVCEVGAPPSKGRGIIMEMLLEPNRESWKCKTSSASPTEGTSKHCPRWRNRWLKISDSEEYREIPGKKQLYPPCPLCPGPCHDIMKVTPKKVRGGQPLKGLWLQWRLTWKSWIDYLPNDTEFWTRNGC